MLAFEYITPAQFDWKAQIKGVMNQESIYIRCKMMYTNTGKTCDLGLSYGPPQMIDADVPVWPVLNGMKDRRCVQWCQVPVRLHEVPLGPVDSVPSS